MKNYLCIVIILIFSFSIYANEGKFGIYGENSFRIIKFSDGGEDYQTKSIKMRNLGIGGVVMLSLGLTFEIGSSVFFSFGLVDYIMATINQESISIRSFVFLYGGIIGVSVFSFVFLGGVAMTIVGFVLSAYYKKRINKVSINTFNDFESNNARLGFVVKL